MPVRSFRLRVHGLGSRARRMATGAAYGGTIALVTTALWLLVRHMLPFAPYEWLFAPFAIWIAGEAVSKLVIERRVTISPSGIAIGKSRLVEYANIRSCERLRDERVNVITREGELIELSPPSFVGRERRRLIVREVIETLRGFGAVVGET